jgi:hypothetical protein
MFSRNAPERLVGACSFAGDPEPLSCDVMVRYAKDRNIFIWVRWLYRPGVPLPDFEAAADRAEALLACIDITEGLVWGSVCP